MHLQHPIWTFGDRRAGRHPTAVRSNSVVNDRSVYGRADSSSIPRRGENGRESSSYVYSSSHPRGVRRAASHPVAELRLQETRDRRRESRRPVIYIHQDRHLIRFHHTSGSGINSTSAALLLQLQTAAAATPLLGVVTL